MAQRAERTIPTDAQPLVEDDEDRTDENLPTMVYVTPEEGRRMFDEAAREMVGMSGEEFIRRYDAGEYATISDDEAHRNIIELGLLVGFGR